MKHDRFRTPRRSRAVSSQPHVDLALEASRSQLGRSEAQSSHPFFELSSGSSQVAQIEAQLGEEQPQFEAALELSRAARVDALRALSGQSALLNQLFPDMNEMKGSARALLVTSTRAIKTLLETTESLDTQAVVMRRTMARCQLSTIEDLHLNMQAAHEVSIATLGSELQVAEVADKLECKRMLESVYKSLDEETTAKVKVVEQAAAQVARHTATVRELEKAMGTDRTELHAQLDHVRKLLCDAQEARRQMGAEMRSAAEVHQHQLDKYHEEQKATESALQEQSAQLRSYAEIVLELQRSHREAVLRVEVFEHRAENAEHYAHHTQELMAEKIAHMHRLQSWALASSSAKALEMREVWELAAEERYASQQLRDGLRPHCLGSGNSRSPLPSRDPCVMPSSRSASRSRALLYMEHAKARLEALSSQNAPQTVPSRLPRGRAPESWSSRERARDMIYSSSMPSCMQRML